MKITLLGATGYVGTRILDEALQRGHEVTAIARHVDTLASRPGLARPGLSPAAIDVADHRHLIPTLKHQEAVVVALKSGSIDRQSLMDAIKEAGVKRLLVIGGAGSLQVLPGVDLVDTPQFPERWKPEAQAAREFLYLLRQETELDWVFLSPSAMLVSGARTGQYRIGGDELLTAADGTSSISLEDLAKAVIDELEMPQHSRRRFTVGY